MKLLTTLFLGLITALCSLSSIAMSEEDMQKMLQAAQAAEECFGKIEPSAFQALETQGKKMEAEIKALCDAGKRDEAMNKAIAISKEMHSDPALKEIKKCSEIMQGAAPQMPKIFTSPIEDNDDNRHICDGF